LSVEKRVLQNNRSARTLFYLTVSIRFLAAALLVAEILLLSEVVNGVFLQQQRLDEVLALLGAILALILVRTGAIWCGDVLAQRAASRVKGSLHQDLTGHLFALGPAYTRTERSGELVNAMVEGVEALDAYLTQYLSARCLAGLVPALVLLVVLALDPWTALVLLFAGPMLLLLLALIGGRAKAITERRFLELSWMSAFFLDVLQGMATLKAFGRSREQATNIEDISRHYGSTTMEVLRTAFQTSLVMEWAATAATALVALEVSLRLMNGKLPFDRTLAVLLLTPEFFLPLRHMALKYHAGTAGKAAAERIFAILNTPVRELRPGSQADTGATPPLPQRFDVRLVDVSYAYDGGRRPALRRFSLTISHGQTVVVVGPTGAGKTTVANLLLRFIEPDSGVITVGGVPLQVLDRSIWRGQVGWVPQLPHLFHGTIADNIWLANPQAGPNEMKTAARAANAHEFIQSLPRGYDTLVGERGARLSGGQQQRIAIARAFLKDAPFLVLDEVTAHLDSKSEELIRDALVRLMRGRTILIIAHRLQLAFGADHIVVMDQGCSVQTGDHQGLMAQQGMYRQLVLTYGGSAK
jgi:thiol reductant ABC exporter CydD subunit